MERNKPNEQSKNRQGSKPLYDFPKETTQEIKNVALVEKRKNMNKSDRKEAFQFLLDRSIESRIQDGRIERVRTYAHDCAMIIRQTEGVVREIIKSNKVLFRTRLDERTGNVTYFEENCGSELRLIFQFAERFLFSTSAPLRLNPLIQIFIDACNKYPGVLGVRPNGTVFPFHKQELFCLLNNFVESIRDMSKTAHMRHELESVSRGVRKNKNSVLSFLSDCLHKNKQASVLEIDLFYSRDIQSGRAQYSIERCIEIQKQRSLWIKKIKRLLPKGGFIGYAWHNIFTLNQDWRVSAIVVIDTSVCLDVANVAIALKNVWQEVTQGGGFGALYRSLMANSEDFRTQLNVAVKRLTYPEYYVQTIAPNGGRTIGHSEISKRK